MVQRIIAVATSAIAVFVIAAGIFITLVSIGVVSRPASEGFDFGG